MLYRIALLPFAEIATDSRHWSSDKKQVIASVFHYPELLIACMSIYLHMQFQAKLLAIFLQMTSMKGNPQLFLWSLRINWKYIFFFGEIFFIFGWTFIFQILEHLPFIRIYRQWFVWISDDFLAQSKTIPLTFPDLHRNNCTLSMKEWVLLSNFKHLFY